MNEQLLTKLQIACASMSEIFTELMNAGFTEQQAIDLLSSLIAKNKEISG